MQSSSTENQTSVWQQVECTEWVVRSTDMLPKLLKQRLARNNVMGEVIGTQNPVSCLAGDLALDVLCSRFRIVERQLNFDVLVEIVGKL